MMKPKPETEGRTMKGYLITFAIGVAAAGAVVLASNKVPQVGALLGKA